MNRILSDSWEKTRSDHRHHAVDAIVIAVADQGAIQRLANAAECMEQQGRERSFDEIDLPWDGFDQAARRAIETIVVSHRQQRRIRGKLHEDTLYSKECNGLRRVRKELWKLTKTDVQKGKIVDRRALALIRERLAELGLDDPAKAFQDRTNCPLVRGAGGRMVPLHRVRVEVGGSYRRFGTGASERYAATASNHHMAFYDRPVPGGGIDRFAEVVPLPDALDRVRDGQPVVDRADRGAHHFAFSLAQGEYVLFDEGVKHERLCRVLSFSHNDLELVGHNDGRTTKDRRGERIRLTKGRIAHGNFHKVYVNYLGEVRDAGG